LYLLFTGDCPVQQEEMNVLAKGGPESKDLLLKALLADGLKSVSENAANLLRQLLDLQASDRITAAAAARHDWMSMDLGGNRAVPARRESYRRMASKSAKEVLDQDAS